jgi:hypothetical protein
VKATVGATRKPVDLPRLRLSVRDAQGPEIDVLNRCPNPARRAAFKSRFARPPAEGRIIDIRFSNKRDIAGASV